MYVAFYLYCLLYSSITYIPYFISATKPKGEAPSLDGQLKPVSVNVGEDVKLVCKMSGKPEPKIEWFKNSKPVKPDYRIKTDYDGTTCTLHIKNTTTDDKGEYKCMASNDFGSVESDADVNVKEQGEKPTIVEKLKEMKVDLGNKATFKVVAKGKPKPEVEWTKGDQTIEDKGRFVIEDDEENGVFKLIIGDVQPEDAGVYNCVVFNEIGETTTSGELHVMKLEVVQQVTPVEEGMNNVNRVCVYICTLFHGAIASLIEWIGLIFCSRYI